MNIPYLNRYRNAEFLQYMTDVLDLLANHDLETLAIQPQHNELAPLVNKIDAVFKQSQGSGLTKDIIALDARRDSAIVGIRSIVEGYTYHFEEGTAIAANLLKDNLSTYGSNIQRLSYQEQTAVMNSIVKDWETNGELQAAVTALNLTNWLTELKAANVNFSAKYLERVGEEAVNPSANITGLREQTTVAYRQLMDHIMAHATLLGQSSTHQNIINHIDVLAGKYNQVVDNRSVTNTETVG